MAAKSSLPFDPESGSLESKLHFPIDTSKLQDISKVPEGKKPVVLLACGSYSPPTVMHMRIFETARDHFRSMSEYLNVEVVGGFVCPVHPAYGKKGLAPPEDRVEMVRRSLASSDWVSVEDWEVKQGEWTRTRLSLDRMQAEVNKVSGGRETGVMLLCGADILDSMVTPGVWMEKDLRGILSRGIVCIKRSGSDPEKLIQENDVLYEYRDRIHLVREWVENNVSSTAVRRAVKRGMSIRYFVADGVLEYIAEKGLYQ